MGFGRIAKWLIVLVGMTVIDAGKGTAQALADTTLEAQIRRVLRKQDSSLKQEDFNHLTWLHTSPADIAVLEGIQQASELRALQIYAQAIRDLGPLAQLSRLAEMDLENNQVEHLKTLCDLHQLQVLNLIANQIRDLGPLSKLTALTYLQLTVNQIRDLGPLGQLENLRTLKLSKNQNRDLGP